MHSLRRGSLGEEKDLLVGLTQELDVPQLQRLQNDFGLCVVQSSTGVALYHLDEDQHQKKCLTPGFDSLNLLESHIEQNMIDILHDYLFESSAT